MIGAFRLGAIAAAVRVSSGGGGGGGGGGASQGLTLVTSGGASNITISADGTTATVGPNASSVWHKARSVAPRTPDAAGRYFEVTVSSNSSGATAIGVAPAGTPTTSDVGGSANAGDGGRLQYFGTGQIRQNGVYSSYGPSFTTGDVIGCSVRAVGANTEIRFYKNGADLGVAFTVATTSFEPHFCAYANTTSEVHTFTLAALQYLPAGFVPWAQNLQAFSATGADQAFTVPAGVTSLTVKAWGAGGASNSATSTEADRARGGPGGFVRATIAVTPGETLTIKVGTGGAFCSRDFGARAPGAGGGRSAVMRGSTPLVIAGGGGGAGGYGASATESFGGVGGGLTGGAGQSGTTNSGGASPGFGGTQSAGGAGGNPGPGIPGSSLQGGSGSGSSIVTPGGWPNGGWASRDPERGGGGGDGYFGGGGGGGGGTWGNGGGGGSSYTAPGATNVAHTQGTPGGTDAPANTDSNYLAGVALPGINGASGGGTGGAGRVVLLW